MNFNRDLIYQGRYLPHCEAGGRPQLITLRLHDSIPRENLRQLFKEADDEHRRCLTERFLDRGLGECLLQRPQAAKVIQEALQFYDGQAYSLQDWVVMPNHIHFLYTNPTQPVGQICKNFKSFTGLTINRLFGRTGALWQRDYHDRYARDPGHLSNMGFYVLLNPVKAGLVNDPFDWEFSSIHSYREEFKKDLRRWYRQWRDQFWFATSRSDEQLR